MTLGADAPAVAVIGGGLAGLAAAVALRGAGCRVDLYEARRMLGGRAASFRDPASGEWVDHCQHVSMGCCTNLADFCRRTMIAELFRHDRRLNFVGPDGRHYPFQANRWLPAPLHLAGAFWSLKYLSPADRWKIARAMWKLMRLRPGDGDDTATVGQWLDTERQSAIAIARFWSVVLISALGEDLDRASLSAARKVIVDGFLASPRAYTVEVPEAPLGVLYGERMAGYFVAHGIGLHLNVPVEKVRRDSCPVVVRSDGLESRPDFVVIALPWTKVASLVSPEIAAEWPWLDEIGRLPPAPITGVHLWFDRPIMTLPHAVLVGRLSQWIFNRGPRRIADSSGGHYYQVVISASRELAGRDRKQIVAEVCGELAAIWPQAATATMLNARVVTEPGAVFSVRPGLQQLRPGQQTPTPGVFVAGDWTATDWPATMESAVRSGYLAAEAITAVIGRPRRFLVPDLPRGLLARLFIKR